jgi:NAD(P)H-nitrite reductase large subunit
MDDNEIVCNCNDITRSEIIEAIKAKKLKTVEDVEDETEAGSVCGACKDTIQEILDEINVG